MLFTAFSMVTFFASLIIPGLGQLMHGKWIAGIIWFAAAVVAGPVVHIFSAIHAGAMRSAGW